MEGFIPVIIMMIIGALFNSGKKKNSEEEQKQSKPFTAQKTDHQSMKKLKEMSRDFYKEIQQEFEEVQEKPVRQTMHIPTEVVPKMDDLKVDLPTKEPRGKTRSALIEERQRSKVHRQERMQHKRQTAKKQLVPTTSDDIMKGVIFSEIIGPPKSKR